MLDDKWSSREVPILVALVEAFEHEPFPVVTLGALADLTELPLNEVAIAARGLGDAGYLDLHVTMGAGSAHAWTIRAISAEARQVAGIWPSPENIAARLMSALEAQRLAEADPVRKRWLTQVLDGAAEISRATAVEVLAATTSRMLMGI